MQVKSKWPNSLCIFSLFTKSESKKEEEFTPRTFLKAKDSILVREYKPQVDDYKPKTFLQAKDSLLVKQRDRLATYPILKRPEGDHSLDESDGLEKITSSELSSSDTESQSTPSESPIHRYAARQVRTNSRLGHESCSPRINIDTVSVAICSI